MVRRALGVLALLLALTSRAYAAPPATCSPNQGHYEITNGQVLQWICTSTNTWTSTINTSTPSGGGVPAGMITLRLTGTCGTGWTEVAALNGKMIRGTVAANANVGTTGGSDSYTPVGVVAAPALTMNSYTPGGTVAAPVITWPVGVPTHTGITATFSGSALAAHAHELPYQIPSTTTIRQIAVATFGTGTSRAATAVSAAGSANTTSAAVALSQAITAGTPAGTVNVTSQGTVAWPVGVPTNTAPGFTGQAATLTGSISAPAFTGNAATVVPAYVNAIFCSKD